MKSISFDRAADIYDQTRGFPPGIADQVADSAAAVLPAAARLLDIGIGTGRIAKPLLARGLAVTGVDLSRKMMRRLIETLPPGAAPPRLVEADGAYLPFASSAFDAVISVHVFHLIGSWREALAEVRRVLKPRGVLLTGYDWRPPNSPGETIFRRWRALIREKGYGPDAPSARDFDDVRRVLEDSGATMDEWSVGDWTRSRSIAQHIETIEHRTWSSTWAVPDEFFPACLAELREWAAREFGSLEREFTIPHKFVWQRFRWDAAAGT